MPVTAGAFTLGAFGILGPPPLAGFVMGLPPGALVQDTDEDRVVMHALAPDVDTAEQFETLQRHVAAT